MNPSILCPKCGGRSTVQETRTTPQGFVERYRECKNCWDRFTTLEAHKDYIEALYLKDVELEQLKTKILNLLEKSK